MKKTLYYSLFIALLITQVVPGMAQTWRGRHVGLPAGFSASRVYGEGTSIIVTNTSAFSGSQVYYTPDSSTAYTASPSTLGMFSTMESDVVRCMGLLFAGSTGGLFKSHDNGHTWMATSMTSAIYALYSHNDTLYASVGAGLGIPQMSVDTGNTWTTFGYTGAMSISFLRSGGRFLAGSTSNLQYTDDFATWHAITTPAGMNGVSMVGLAELSGNLYAACSTGVYKSADNGSTWSNVLARTMFSLKAVDTSLFGGTSINGMFQSGQNGVTWTAINNGLPYTGVATYNSINSIAYNDDYLICSAGGDSAVYVIGLASLGLHPASSTLNTQMTNENIDYIISPNPANSELSITVFDRAKGLPQISMFDMAGRSFPITTESDKSRITIPLQGIPAGTYMIRVIQGKASLVKKVVIIR